MTPLNRLHERKESLFRFVIYSSIHFMRSAFPMAVILFALNLIVSLIFFDNNGLGVQAFVNVIIWIFYGCCFFIFFRQFGDWLNGRNTKWSTRFLDAGKAGVLWLIIWTLPALPMIAVSLLSFFVFPLKLQDLFANISIFSICFLFLTLFFIATFIMLRLGIFISVVLGAIMSSEKVSLESWQEVKFLLKGKYAHVLWYQFLTYMPIFCFSLISMAISSLFKAFSFTEDLTVAIYIFNALSSVVIMTLSCSASLTVYYRLVFDSSCSKISDQPQQ